MRRKKANKTTPSQRPVCLTPRLSIIAKQLLLILGVEMCFGEIDENLLLCYLGCMYTSPLLSFPQPRFRLHFNSFDQQECYNRLRFRQEDLWRLLKVCNLPAIVRTKSKYAFSSQEALMITLMRLATPNRLFDLERIVGRPRSHISECVFAVVQFLSINHQDKFNINSFCKWMVMFPQFVSAIKAPVGDVVAFVDGTLRPCCRPRKNNIQQAIFSGQKRNHGLKFTSIVAPNGMIFISDAICGRRHDSYGLRRSGILEKLRELNLVSGTHYKLFGDSAYARSDVLERMHKGQLSSEEEEENRIMSPKRVCVEWCFGNILNLWSFVDYERNLKLFLSPIGLYYQVSILFTNMHTTLYGNQTSIYFDMKPPTLEEYMK